MSDSYSITTYDDVGRLLVAKTVQDPLPVGWDGPYQRSVPGWHNQLEKYVVSGMVVDRLDNPTQITGTTLYNIPLPAQIEINAVTYDATDSTMELDLPVPGDYNIVVMSFPHKPAYFMLNL